MSDAISSLRQLAMHLRAADLLDIAVVTALVYLALLWLKTRASRTLLIGLLGVAALYLLSRTLNLYLTAAIFRAGMTAILLALIVIFQQDIRDGFERAVSWTRLRAHRPTDPTAETIDTLTEAAAILARERIGALIVLKGREYLGRHLQAGTPIDGMISLPLLRSIFDPHSPGHDGAVVMEGDRLSMFGAHLPLSRDHPQVGAGGTRHLAALGLAERSDALVLAISEERGTISLAQGGRIEIIGSADELRRRLERFFEHQVPGGVRPAGRDLLSRNFGLRLSSLGLAVLLWLLFAYRIESVQETYSVPIEYRNIASDMAIDGNEPTLANVTLSGPERSFRDLSANRLRMVVDLAGVPAGPHTITLSEQNLQQKGMLPIPSGLSIVDMNPRTIQLEVFRLETIQVPVQAWPVGHLPGPLQLAQMSVRPSSVTLRIRSSEAGRIEEVYTQPIKLSGIHGDQTIKVGLLLPPHAQLAEGEAATVEVTLTVKKTAGRSAEAGDPEKGEPYRAERLAVP